MNKTAGLALAASMAATSAFAGGPVVIIDDGAPVVVTTGPSSSISPGLVVAGIAALIVICAIACDSGNDNGQTTPAIP